MLYPLIFIIFLLNNNILAGEHTTSYAYGCAQEQKSCRISPQTSLVQELARRNTSYLNSDLSDSFLTQLQQESLQKVEALQKDSAFQKTVKVLLNQSSQSQSPAVNSTPKTQGSLNEVNLNEANLSEASLYIFVSFSMGEKALLNLAHEAKRFGAILILRGFHEGSYVKTAQALQKIILKTGQGVVIDPELYSLFNITSVPTFVLAKPFSLQVQDRIQTPLHDKLQGHVGIQYTLETFVKEGDLKDDVHALLSRGSFKEDSFKEGSF